MVMKVRTFTLGSGADTVVFDSTVGANGTDKVTGFVSGTDKLDVTTNSYISSVTFGSGDATAGAFDASGKTVVFLSAGANNGVKFASGDSGKKVIAILNGSDVDVYYVTANQDTAITTFNDKVATLVGVTEVVGSDFV